MFRILLMAAAFGLLSSGLATADETVRYQCPEWKAKHIHDEAKADTIEKTLKKLKCEVERSEHNGHIDLKYRCKEWHTLKLDTHDEAHKWESWLKAFGFNTEHKH
ncbi:hypothetical protein Q31b_32070 [Novipirellula aureliae]|uniref:Uncharacterized protein n=1 Tax=Novipirellula aureliae TaxID=2527966 RepID=A0A5C6DWY2_9BACT|nr:hypothetical protein [Novipirellula aureliae]TWU39891.1 hypothetical protein Q31b_32070 [Novipirellula aureliae]